MLRDPARLARALGSASPAGLQRPHAIVSARRIEDPTYRGFAISLAPSDGRKPPAYGAAFGRRTREALKLVLVIGDDEDGRARDPHRVAERDAEM